MAPGVVQNSSGQAYKPKVAVVSQQMQQQNATTAKMNGTTHSGAGKKVKGTTAIKAKIYIFLGGAMTKSASEANIGLQGLAGAAAGGGIQLSTLPPQHFHVLINLNLKNTQKNFR